MPKGYGRPLTAAQRELNRNNIMFANTGRKLGNENAEANFMVRQFGLPPFDNEDLRRRERSKGTASPTLEEERKRKKKRKRTIAEGGN